MSIQEHYDVRAILARAAQLGIKISLVGDDLKLDAAPGVITPQVLTVVKAQKQEIIEHLRQTPCSTPPAPAPRVDSRKLASEIDEAYQLLLQRGRINQAGQRVIDWTVPGSDFPREYDITLDEYRTRLCVCLFNGGYDRFYAGLDELARIQAQPLQQESGLTPGQAYDQTLATLKGRLGLTVEPQKVIEATTPPETQKTMSRDRFMEIAHSFAAAIPGGCEVRINPPGYTIEDRARELAQEIRKRQLERESLISTSPEEYWANVRARLGDFVAEVPAEMLAHAQRPRTYPAPFPKLELQLGDDGRYHLATVGTWDTNVEAPLLAST